MNDRLQNEPELLNKKAFSDGYIAIVQPRREEEETICAKSPHLIPSDEYLKLPRSL
jgi:glycine cleavage system H lipoate-binding protein